MSPTELSPSGIRQIATARYNVTMYNTELVNHKFVETYETLVRNGVKIDILTELTKEDQEALEKDLRSRRDIVTINWDGWKAKKP